MNWHLKCCGATWWTNNVMPCTNVSSFFTYLKAWHIQQLCTYLSVQDESPQMLCYPLSLIQCTLPHFRFLVIILKLPAMHRPTDTQIQPSRRMYLHKVSLKRELGGDPCCSSLPEAHRRPVSSAAILGIVSLFPRHWVSFKSSTLVKLTVQLLEGFVLVKNA